MLLGFLAAYCCPIFIFHTLPVASIIASPFIGTMLFNIMVILLPKYATISVPIFVKKRLEKLKGDMDWGDFLLMLCDEYEKFSKEKAFNDLVGILNEDDLKRIEESMSEFRKNFKLRGH